MQSQAPLSPHVQAGISPVAMMRSIASHWQLIAMMSRKEVIGRYRGSILGLAWSFFYPVLMLLVYTFVFSVIFNARWGLTENEPRSQFALILFSGLIVHGLLAEVLNKAPLLVISNTNYVKRVIFPLEILPVITLVAALFHALVSFTVLTIGLIVVNLTLSWTALLLPVIIIPFIVMIAGLAWMLASLGVFLRDVGHTIGVLTTAMLFLAPVFYPISAVPESMQTVIMLNPITLIIEQVRAVLILGVLPDWMALLRYSVVALIVACVGFAWFQKTRKGFADVI